MINNIAIIGCSYFENEIKSLGYATPKILKSLFVVRILLIMRKLGIGIPDSWFVNKKQIERLSEYDVVILFDSTLQFGLPHMVYSIIGSRNRLIFYFWNTCQLNFSELDLLLKDFRVCSFDKSDYEKYSIPFVDTFYFKSLVNNSELLIYDGLFVGFDKGRAKIVNYLSSLLESIGKQNYIRIVKPGLFGVKKISYQAICNLIGQSRILIDVVKEGQTGLTLRSLEALFFGKKLITNNLSLRSNRLFPQKNILYLMDNIDDKNIKEFCNKELQKANDEALDYYDFSIWIKRVLEV